jgi:hypothetical protein
MAEATQPVMRYLLCNLLFHKQRQMEHGSTYRTVSYPTSLHLDMVCLNTWTWTGEAILQGVLPYFGGLGLDNTIAVL